MPAININCSHLRSVKTMTNIFTIKGQTEGRVLRTVHFPQKYVRIIEASKISLFQLNPTVVQTKRKSL